MKTLILILALLSSSFILVIWLSSLILEKFKDTKLAEFVRNHIMTDEDFENRK